jgi:hypothetical protein
MLFYPTLIKNNEIINKDKFIYPCRPGTLVFEFVVGTCTKTLLLGGNKQI